MPFVKPAVCVSLHDVSPVTWSRCERLLSALHAVADFPLTLLVVPDYHRSGNITDAGYNNALDKLVARGSELALHGYYHLDEAPPAKNPFAYLKRSWYTASEGEFSALTKSEATQRIEQGLEWFHKHEWKASGFVAPAWLMSKGTWEALSESPFRYVTTLKNFYLLPQANKYPAQSLVYSTRGVLRRRLSRIWNRSLYQRLGDSPLLRLSLHPDDVLYPEVVKDWQRFLALALESRVAMTKQDFAKIAAEGISY